MFRSGRFAKCLELRDKYMEISLQRLGDNPRDHDGTFTGFHPANKADVTGLRPDADPKNADEDPAGPSDNAWKIYPAPPPPHWHWTSPGKENGEGGEGFDESDHKPTDGSVASIPVDTYSLRKKQDRGTNGSEGFDMQACEIPGVDERGWGFKMDASGVYQVYEHEPTESNKDQKPIFRNVSLKEYYTDLDYVLGVCSDGPAKSFAFRRLKYLQSKWSLYCLLNEYQEIADMKAVPHR